MFCKNCGSVLIEAPNANGNDVSICIQCDTMEEQEIPLPSTTIGASTENNKTEE